MADLTSKYRKKELRDISMQACITAIEQASLEFPENCYSGKFTDFFDIEGGTQPPKSKFIYHPTKGYIRFLQIRDFSSENTQTYIPIDPKNKLCYEDDILLGRYGASVGKILTGKVGAYNVACTKVKILNEKIINKEFLFYLLHSTTIQESIKNISRSAQGGFNKGDLNKIDILIPKIEWQIKLIEILKWIDDFLINNSELTFPRFKDEYLKFIIDLLQKRLGVIKEIEELTKELESQKTFLKQLRHAILQEAVQGKLTRQNKTDEPASALLKRIKTEKQKLIAAGKMKKEKELPPISKEEIPSELPKGWVWCRFGDASISRDGERVPLSMEIRKAMQGVYDYYGAQGVIDNINDFLFDKSLLLIAEDGGNLLRRTKPVAYFAHGKYWVNNHAHVIDAFNYSTLEYLEIFINSIDLKPYLNGEPPMQIKLNQGKLNIIPVPLPPLSEQNRIVIKVQQLMQMVRQLEQQVEESQTQVKQLLHAVLKEAFTRKGKVYEMNEEVMMAAEN